MGRLPIEAHKYIVISKLASFKGYKRGVYSLFRLTAANRNVILVALKLVLGFGLSEI